jgi:drug/metabolite transporter (DMT)-like permease
LGFCGHTLYQAFFINGLARTTPAVASLLMATSPLFVAIYAYVLRIERTRPLVVVGIAVSFLGVLLLLAGGQGDLSLRSDAVLGNLFVLIAAMMWAGYTLGGKPLLGRYSPLKLNALTMAPGTLFLTIISLPQIAGQDWAAVTPGAWAALAYSTIFAVVVGYVLWYTGVQRIGGARTAIYSNLTPVIAAVSAALFLGDRLQPLQLVGALVVIIGIWLTRRGRNG